MLATPVRPANAASLGPIRQWAMDCDAAGHSILIPEIVDYEVRRELLRANKIASVAELDRLQTDLTYLPLTTSACRKAAELRAAVWQAGQPTAHDENIDVDVILAAQVVTSGLPSADCVVATVNQRHLSRFVAAARWEDIMP
jgi:predicted nucleic acid-binding protein